jgi:hypothetical protein
VVLDGRQIDGGEKMKNKKTEKSKAELEKEELEFLEKNSRDLEKSLTGLCLKYNLPYEAPYDDDERKEIIGLAYAAEHAELLKAFPNYPYLPEPEKTSAKLILKFGLNRNLSLKDGPAIQRAIAKVLEKKGSTRSVDPAFYKFKK